jgi:dinuclear metal center YbgI/SA1388 family protein
MTQVLTDELVQWLDMTLHAHAFQDYCPNGLQVQGTPTIRHIIAGVTASQALLDVAIERGADAVLVHHGWFWKNESPRIIGAKHNRLSTALKHDLNVIAYHLPLDAHPTLGNNATLGQVLDIEPLRNTDGQPLTYGRENLIWMGTMAQTLTLESLAIHIEDRLRRQPLVVGNLQHACRRIAWCTGGAQGMMQAAIDAGADVYITGEASEPNFHLARESGIGFIAAGHHATERYGVQALGDAINRQFDIRVEFVDIDNPI